MTLAAFGESLINGIVFSKVGTKPMSVTNVVML